MTGAQEELTAANELVDHALKDVRAAIYALRPSPLDQLGIEFDPGDGGAGAPHPFGPEVEVLLAASLDARVAPEMESALDRIIQEVLNNICKHAEARRVSVRIEPGENEIRIDRRAGRTLGGAPAGTPPGRTPFRRRSGLPISPKEFSAPAGYSI